MLKVSAVLEPSTCLFILADLGGIGPMPRRAKNKMGFWFNEALAT
jgi:hypothetical protein